MKDWFKARNIWGAAILSLSDAEAGRLAKALWSYTMSGEEQNLSGAEKGIFAMIQLTLSQDDCRESEISEKRAIAGALGGKQKQANIANANFATKEEEQKEPEKPKQKRFQPPTLEEVKAYCAERNNSVDAEHWFDYYTSNGWRVGKNPMKDWKGAVRTWEKSEIGKKPVKTVSGQQYTQRSYSNTQADAMNRFLAENMEG